MKKILTILILTSVTSITYANPPLWGMNPNNQTANYNKTVTNPLWGMSNHTNAFNPNKILLHNIIQNTAKTPTTPKTGVLYYKSTNPGPVSQ